jgi:diguanylate cyclase (GGDEF)-like protein
MSTGLPVFLKRNAVMRRFKKESIRCKALIRFAAGKLSFFKTSLQWFHWLIIGLSLVVTLVAWYLAKEQVIEKKRLMFVRDSDRIVSMVYDRMNKYADALYGGAAYITAVENDFSRSDWAVYSQNLSLTSRYPGINGIGVIYAISKDDMKAFSLKQRKGFPGFKIYPAHNKKISLPIVYIEPIDINKQAVGLDMAHEVNRFTAAKKARDTGTAQITGPIVLVQDQEKTPGFLFFVPLYKKVALNGSLKKDFLGLVYAPFITKKLIYGVLSESTREIKMQIKDEGVSVYSEFSKREDSVSLKKTGFYKIYRQEMFGRTWVFEIASSKKFDGLGSSRQPTMILLAGILIDILLFFLFIMLVKANKKSESYADEMRSKVREKTRELEKIAHYDSLTSLPNRANFLEVLSENVRCYSSSGGVFAVCFIDIDNFKEVNDRLGHTVGDNLLVKFAAIMHPSMHKSDFIARLGGDEFALIINNMSTIDDLIKILNVFVDKFNQPIDVTGYEINSSISIGASIYPRSAKTVSELISHADIAMYRAKELGKNGFRIYSKEMDEVIARRREVSDQLRHAVENNELRLVYQPQIDIKRKKLVGVEALLRWDNPKLGEVCPDEFIAIAEENGFIVSIGRWVLQRSSKDLELMKVHVDVSDHFKLSINTSVKELEKSNFIDSIKGCFAKNEDLKLHLHFEITESQFMENYDKVIKNIQKINNIGCGFSLDDFGTGYSSMLYLKNLPVRFLKIDKEFVRDIADDPGDAAIVKAIIALSHSLGIQVIAEGVETVQQLEFLEENLCDQVQGYYFSRPLPLIDLIAWIKEGETGYKPDV